MLEYEKKIMLTENEYLSLLQLADKSVHSIKQINYYYDSDNLKMNKQGITCRIREKNGKYKATIKAHRSNNQDCSIEKTKEAESQYDDSLFEGLHLKYQGCLTTERTVLYCEIGCEVVLDKNTYLGTTDYELEVEYRSGMKIRAVGLLHNCLAQLYSPMTSLLIGNARTKKCKSKSERFFKRKEELS